MALVTEVKKQDIFKREKTISNPWLDAKFNKVESLGGEPGFKVDDIPERLGLVQQGYNVFSPTYYVSDVEGMPSDYGTKGQFLQTDGKSELSWAWPLWSKSGSTVYYKLGKVAIGHAAPQEIFHIAKGEETIASRISCNISPWRQWECLDSGYGFALGIAADDKKFHVHYDTPMGTVSVHLMCFDGLNSRVGILQDTPLYPFDVNGAARFDDLYLNDTNASHVALVHWNEDEASANRILNFTLSGGDRTFALHGNLTVEAASLVNQDLTTDARVIFAGIDSTSYIKLSNNNELRFYDNGNYVGFEAPALGADQIWVLPSADGGAGTVLSTDGGGVLSWITAADVKVAIDSGATADYLGAASNDGCLRVGANITYTDGGNFVTLDTVQNIGTGDSPTFAALTVSGAINSMFVSVVATDNYIFSDVVPPGLSGAVSNVLIGKDAGESIASADFNICVGGASGSALTTGHENVLVGYFAGNVCTSSDNVMIGHGAGALTTSGPSNVYIGWLAGWANVTGTRNIAIGFRAGRGVPTNSWSDNVFVGYYAGNGITTGTGNMFLGAYAGQSVTSGNENVFVGSQAGRSATTVAGATCVGHTAGQVLTATAELFGNDTGKACTSGAENCAFGKQAMLYNVTGQRNSLFGYQAGAGVIGNSYSYNTGIGWKTLHVVTTGSNNSCLGVGSGASITTGSGNVCIGYYAGETNLVAGNNQLWIANSNTATPLIYGEFDNGFITINGYLNITTLKSGATQGAAGAAAGELWKTASHATLPDNVVMMGV